jgi:uncharacterized protein YbjT (DUF2867 family)
MIVVTTPTGNIGHHVVQHLLDAGEPLRVIVRDPAKLPQTVRDRVDIVAGSHSDAAIVDRAFEGADTVFWLCPPSRSSTPEGATSRSPGRRPRPCAATASATSLRRPISGAAPRGRTRPAS